MSKQTSALTDIAVSALTVLLDSLPAGQPRVMIEAAIAAVQDAHRAIVVDEMIAQALQEGAEI